MESDPILNHPLVVAMHAALQAQCAAAVAENAALRADNAALRLEMSKLRETMEGLTKVMEALQGRLAKDSHNSHKPPGSDGPQTPPGPPAPPTGRTRGGQLGRTGKGRKLLPEGSEKRTVEVPLTTCPHCACAVPPSAISGSVTHRVLDLVRELTEVVAFRLEEGCCPHCHKDIQANLPPEAGVGGLGPRLRGVGAYLRTHGRMSIGPLHYFFREVLKAEVSRGWLYESGVRVSDDVAATWEGLGKDVACAPVVNMDETGFGHKKRDWIWVALTARTAFFHFSTTRGFDALKAILPENYSGVLCTDRYSTYKMLKLAVRQFCWAHLRRELIALSEARDATVARIGKQMLEDQERIFDLWHQYRGQDLDRSALCQQTSIIRARMKHNLRLASRTEHKAARTLGKSLIKNWDKLWTFLRIDGVEPTNNSAERALRPLVILKRIFQRLPSDRGKKFFERLFSIGATARIRGVPYFDWLIKALHAAHQGMPLPELEPA